MTISRDLATIAGGDAGATSHLKSGLEFRGFGQVQFALGQRLGKEFLDLELFAVLGHGQLADQQVTSPLQHLFLAE